MGFGAGSKFATYELSAIMMVCFDETTKIYPCLHITIMVDDVNMEQEGSDEEELVSSFVGAAAHTAGQLKELQLPLATEKSFTLGSSWHLASKVARMLGDGGAKGTTVRRLGVDHALNPRHKKWQVRGGRLQAYRIKFKQLRSLTRTGKVKGFRVFVAGLMPAALYGSEFGLPPPAVLRRLNTDCAKTARLATMAVPTDLSLVGLPPNSVPEFVALQAPLLRWSRELWMLYGDEENRHLDVLKANVLRQAAEAIQGERPHGCVLQAVRQCLMALGWTMQSMTTVVSDEGVALDLTKTTPPQQLKRYLKQAFERLLDRRVHAAALRRGLVAEAGEGFNLLALRRVLRTPEKKMALWVKRRILAKLWNVLPTSEWLARHGWQTAPFCVCGEVDDMAHRMGGCFLEIEGVCAAAGEFGLEAAELNLSLDDLRLGRVDRPSEVIFTCYENGSPVSIDDIAFGRDYGDVYIDGSLMHAGTPAALAGAAVGQQCDSGFRSIKITLPWQCPLTAGFAEHYAAMVASRVMCEDNSVVSDCAAVVTNFGLSRAAATVYSNTMAGLMMHSDLEFVQQVKKTKAHRSAAEAALRGSEEVVAHKLNEWVDQIAKRAVLDGLDEVQEQVEHVTAALQSQVARLRGMGKIFAGQCWPKVVGMERVPWAPVARNVEARLQHSFVYTHALRCWQCTECHRRTASAAKATALMRSRCWKSGLPRSIFEQDHRLRFLRESPGASGHQLVYCSRCGHYGQVHFVGLSRPCKGRNSGQAAGLRWLCQGLHPDAKKRAAGLHYTDVTALPVGRRCYLRPAAAQPFLLPLTCEVAPCWQIPSFGLRAGAAGSNFEAEVFSEHGLHEDASLSLTQALEDILDEVGTPVAADCGFDDDDAELISEGGSQCSKGTDGPPSG